MQSLMVVTINKEINSKKHVTYFYQLSDCYLLDKNFFNHKKILGNFFYQIFTTLSENVESLPSLPASIRTSTTDLSTLSSPK